MTGNLNKRLTPPRIKRFSYLTKGSYLAICPRDESGHCLPKDEADRTGQKKPKSPRKKRGYQDKISAMPVDKEPLKLVSEDEMRVLNKLVGCAKEGDREWLDKDPSSLGRVMLDAACLNERFTKEELDKLSDPSQEGDRLLGRSHLVGDGKYEEQYNLTLMAKNKRTFQINGMTELKPPQTKSEVDALAKIIEREGTAFIHKVAEYLETDAATLIGDVSGTLNEMLYRHYNPVPVWDRIDKDKATQETLSKLANMDEEISKNQRYQDLKQAEEESHKEFDTLTDKITALNDKIYSNTGEGIDVPKDANGFPDLRQVERGLTAILGEDLGRRQLNRVKRNLEDYLKQIESGKIPAYIAKGELDTMVRGILASAPYRTERDKLEKESERLSERISGIIEERMAIKKNLQETVVGKALRVKNAAEIKITGMDTAKHSTDEIDRVSDAVRWLTEKVAQGKDGKGPRQYSVTNNNQPFYGRPGPSAYYSPNSHAINVPTGMVSVATNVHEMAHGFEFDIPGVMSSAQRFLKHRVKDQPLRKLKEVLPNHDYADWEEGRDDDFAKALGKASAWYAGKKELSNGATEIVSMGVEQLYRDPVAFAKNDPEYCGFIIGMLNGRIRDVEVPK